MGESQEPSAAAAAAHQEEIEVLEAVRARVDERDRRRAVDQAETQQAAAMWSRAQRLAMPAYLRREASRTASRGRTVPLGALPTSAAGDALHWLADFPLGGIEHQALVADVPARFAWELDLDRPAAVSGVVGLRPDAWQIFQEPLELRVRLVGADGARLLEEGVVIHPARRAMDRRWVPWRVPLPPAGRARLELETASPEGTLDRAWLVIGAPVLELGTSAVGRRRSRPRLARGATPPRIALLMPVHDPPLSLLERTLGSVAAQSSDGWELCVTDDGSRDPAVIERLQRASASDPRIQLVRHEVARGISAATNAALALATAPYVATLDHDDLLSPHAIERVAARLATDPSVDVLYTDHDVVAGDEDLTFSASLKPSWSPDLLRACMYTVHLGVYRRALVEEIGGWRSAFDGAQDHDLVLRLTERTSRVAHVPEIHAHWRAHAGSAALGELAKPTAYERGREAVAEHLARTGVEGSVERLPWAGRLRVRLPRRASVTVVLPTGATMDLEAAWRAALRDDDVLRRAPAGSSLLATWQAATQELPEGAAVLVVEDAAAPLGTDDIDELVGHLEVGAAAAGGLVAAPDGAVVAGAVAFPDGLPVGLHVGSDANDPERHPSLTMVSNRLAVRGVVALRAGALRAARDGGVDPLGLVAVTEQLAGDGRIVWSPHARFVADPAAAARWRTTRLGALAALDRGAAPDPFWNPRRRPDRSDESYDESIHDVVPG